MLDWPKRWWLFFGIVIGLLGCSGADEEADVVIVATPKLSQAADGSSSLSGVAIEGTADQEPAVFSLEATPTIVPETAESGVINSWVAISPPAGWVVAEGRDEVVIAYQALGQNRLLESYVSVARWGNQIGEDGWIAPFPEGVEEADGRYTFRMAGRLWRGVFVRGEADSYRAFWAYTNEDPIYSYSLIVFMPRAADLPESGVMAESDLLFDQWQGIAPDINTILKRLALVAEE